MAVKRSQKTIKTARRSTKESKRIVKPSSLKHGGDFGKLTLQKHINANRKANQEEIKKYEKKYLSRYKEPKNGIKKSKPSKEYNEDLGRLNFREHVVTKREKLKAERNEYEKKYVARYLKQQKLKQKKKK